MLETEPRDLLLEDNDLVITTDLAFSSGVSGVAQSCKTAMQMFQGEWFLNLDAGIPYWGEILGQKPAIAIAAATAHFTEMLLSIEDVTSVSRMSVTYEASSRTLSVRWQVRCTFGQTPVDTLAINV
jgi:hypothetical protein